MAASAQQGELNLMPYPANVEMGSGVFLAGPGLQVKLEGPADRVLQGAVQRFQDDLVRQTGVPRALPGAAQAAAPQVTIRTKAAVTAPLALGVDESYTLEAGASGVTIEAPTTLGGLRGLATLLQLVQPGSEGWVVPALKIRDQPRFPWRGIMIDSCRHWMPVEVVKRTLDGMAAVKMNVLHWHLSEDQGFRVESKTFPKLHQMGSDGLYYTQQQIREVIAYAHERGIRVVPEFDMPGHTTAWFAGHPELASGPGPFPIERSWGIFDPSMDPTQESTYKFLDKFIEEMAGLFPDQYFHIGGDEVTGKPWDANPRIQEFKKQEGLKDNHDLQGYFNMRVQKLVAKHKKIMMGWDEILHPGLPKDVVVHSWRGPKGLAAAAKQGNRTLLSNGFYLDLNFPASQHYAVEPLSGDAANLSAEEQLRVLGGEACMWAEFVSPENIDSRLWPRAGAVAERLWSPQARRDVESMYRRLKHLSAFLSRAGMNHETNFRPMLQRIAGTQDVEALRAVAEMVEPVKEYKRGQLQKYTQATPLNRLVDAARPESWTGREFALAVDRMVSGRANPGDEAWVRSLLERWRDQSAKLQAGPRTFLMEEVLPISADLGQMGAMGLQALDAMKEKKALPAGWMEQQMAVLEQAKQPKAALLNMAAAPVEKLVRAAAR